MSTFVEIPIDNAGDSPELVITTRLGGKSYVLRFRWGELAQAWTVDVDTEAGEPIVTGRLVALQRNLLAGATHPDRPKGVLFAARDTNSVELPSLKGLGESVRVYHGF